MCNRYRRGRSSPRERYFFGWSFRLTLSFYTSVDRWRHEAAVEASRPCNAHQHCIQENTSVCLFTDVWPSTGQEVLSPLQEPASATRPAIGSRIAILGMYFNIRIRRALLWFSFQTLAGKAGTLAHVL